MGANGQTALMYAAVKGYRKIVGILIEHGANINATDANGDSALIQVAQQGQN